jgi:thiol:disulfide interchange protein DsbA
VRLPIRSAAVFTVLATGLLATPAAAVPPHLATAPYVRLDHPQPVPDAATQEAVEFFWYDCEHSARLEQPLEQWADHHRGEVTLRRVPAIWPGGPNVPEQTAHARLYYTLERLGAVDRLQKAVFQAVHGRHIDLTTEDRAADWAARQGLDRAGFRAAYESAEVGREVEQAPEVFRRYEVAELPTVVVDGRYRTGPAEAGGVDRVPGVLDQLLRQR